MHLSKHCRERMNQRGFTYNMLELVVKYGNTSKKNCVNRINLGHKNLGQLKEEMKSLQDDIKDCALKEKELLAEKCHLKESKNAQECDNLIKSEKTDQVGGRIQQLDKIICLYRRQAKSYKKRLKDLRHLIDKNTIELLYSKNSEVITIYKKSKRTF